MATWQYAIGESSGPVSAKQTILYERYHCYLQHCYRSVRTSMLWE